MFNSSFPSLAGYFFQFLCNPLCLMCLEDADRSYCTDTGTLLLIYCLLTTVADACNIMYDGSGWYLHLDIAALVLYVCKIYFKKYE